MRKITTIVAIVATIIMGDAIADVKWNDSNRDVYETATNFDIYGVVNGRTTFNVHLNNKNTRISDLYSSGGAIVTNGGTLVIDRFWTTLDMHAKTIGSGAGTITIGEYILQVGQKKVGQTESFDGYTFGTATQTACEALFMTDTYVMYGTHINDNWGIVRNGENKTTFRIDNYGTVNNATIKGGTFNNYGAITNLTYSGGTFFGEDGNIVSLTVAGELSGDQWGTVEKLQFANDGSGIVHIAAFAGETVYGFQGIKANHVDLTSGNIVLDLTDVVVLGDDWRFTFFDTFGDVFSFATLFRATEITGIERINSFKVHWEDEIFWILHEGDFIADDWFFTNAGLTWNGYVPGFYCYSSLPEPATFVILGFGLAGLGLERRRVRKRVAGA